jgi:hypothetical protein
MIAMLLVRQCDASQEIEGVIRIEGFFRQRASQRPHEAGRVAGEYRRLLVSFQQAINDEIDDPVPQAPHLLGRHTEGVAGRIYESH